LYDEKRTLTLIVHVQHAKHQTQLSLLRKADNDWIL